MWETTEARSVPAPGFALWPVTEATPEGTLKYTYDAAGNLALLSSSHSNGISVDYTCDTHNRLSTVVDNRLDSGANTVTCAYDSAGNVASATLPNGAESVMTYDSLNRLTSAAPTTGNFYGCTESYDPFGNRTGQSIHGTGTTCTSPTNPVAAGTNRLSDPTVNYDAAGNQQVSYNGGSAVAMTWDAEGRLASSTPAGGATTTYVYGADGQRAGKIVGGVETNYVRDLDGSLLVTYLNGSFNNGNQELWVNGKHFGTVSVTSGSATTQTQNFSLTNWLGTEMARTDPATGIPTAGFISQPFGDGQTILFGSDNDPLHFTGKERDSESGNDYFGARYYASSMGRWMSPDWSAKYEPVPYAKLGDPQTLNLYAYVGNNPLSRTDTDGHATCDSSACREAAFAVQHPLIAREVGSVVTGLPFGMHSTNISTNAVRFSAGMGLSENAAHEGSEVNAVRHTLWSATITSNYGKDIAQQIGNAHEENPNVDLSVRTFSGKGAMAQADQSVDLLNNQIGQSIGAANPGASMNQLAGAALDYYHSTGLYTASTNADGSVSISQTKLSDQQYSAAKDQLQKMDKQGFQH